MRILIAEDNECFRLLLCIALHGHDVIVAEDGAQAIACAECYQPDIVLMDVMMPEVDGITALQHLKAGEITADIPVVLMSADCVRQQDIKYALDLGAEDYWGKPFSVLGLDKMLEDHITKKKSPGEART